MKAEPAIIIDNLWKTYHRGRVRRGDIRQNFSFWWNNLRSRTEQFNALESIHLKINKGEIVGIVGPNGAGKSTLLKVLSRITYPTKGRVVIHGKLSSLIEVGVGFHPELTGRDNIYLNGSISGMSQREIEKKFESIVAFSGLEDYLDTPVKQYSSGMYVRLAFSVSAHLDSDILLLDEILSVGDMEFRKKSLDKITENFNQGRTIVMVSHQLDILKAHCTSGIYLDKGKVKKTGTIDEVIDQYLEDHSEMVGQDLRTRADRQGSGKALVSSITFVDRNGLALPSLQSGQFVKILVSISSHESRLRNVDIRLDVFDKMGQQWFVLSNNISDGMMEEAPGNVVLECEIPKLPLAEGHYVINASLNVHGQKSDFIQNAAAMEVVPGNFYTTGRLPGSSKGVLIPYHWSLKGSA